MALQHLRSSTANKRPAPGSMSDGQLAINTNDGSPGLFFKNSNGALVKIGPVHVGTTAPNASPASGGTAGNSVGEQWLDTSSSRYVFKIWDGTAWRSESGEFVDAAGDVMTGALGIIAGSAGSPGLYVSGDTNTGIYSPGADQLALATGGSGRLFVDASGKVGIGTSSPSAVLYVNNASGVDPSLTYGATAGQTFKTGTTELAFGAATSAPFAHWIQARFSTNAAQPLLLNPLGGNVGIGDAGPDSTLTIKAAASTTPLRVSGPSSEFMRCDQSGRLLVGTSSTFAVGGGSRLFQIEGTDSGQSIVQHSGTNAGSAPVFVLGRSRSTSNSGVTAVAQNDVLGYFQFAGANGSNLNNVAAEIRAEVDGGVSGGGANDLPGRLVFSTTADGASSPTERMRITQAGYVVIGDSGLVTGRLSIGNYTDGGVYGIEMKPSANNATPLAFRNAAGSIVGTVTTTSSATSYVTSSDYRLKENVTVVVDGITRLQQLKPSRFNFIADPTKTVDGFIAHEVQTVVPEAITGTKDEVDADGTPIYQGIDQSKLVPLLTAALQEAVAKIESLEARLTAAGI